MKNIFKGIGILLGIFVVLNLFAFKTGTVDLQFYKYFGKQQANADREIFKENTTYIEGKADDLAKFKFELIKEKDPVARQAIVSTIIQRYSDFDPSKLEDQSLAKFLNDVKEGRIK